MEMLLDFFFSAPQESLELSCHVRKVMLCRLSSEQGNLTYESKEEIKLLDKSWRGWEVK